MYRKNVTELKPVLDDIILFYSEKGIKPIIYQSIRDNGYFESMRNELLECGFESWNETQKYMVLSDENTINPNRDITVRMVCEWTDEYGTEIFEKAGEPWEIDVVKRH